MVKVLLAPTVKMPTVAASMPVTFNAAPKVTPPAPFKV